MLLTIFIGLSVMALGALSFADELRKLDPHKKKKLAAYIFLSVLVILLTVGKDKISEQDRIVEKRADMGVLDSTRRADKLEANHQRNADKLEMRRRDSLNDERLRAYQVKTNKPPVLPINAIKLKSTLEGLILNYHITQKIEHLNLIWVLDTFDSTLGESFGDNKIIPIPAKIGDNSYIISESLIPLGHNLSLQIKGDAPYISTPIIELGYLGSITIDNTKITTDNTNIIADQN